ncbi:hypothetical protein DFH27DRAFT_392045 [Peziza echinospora]|nr:hypothetical protein DFH27DRAFT_392045 [Peziza echinospora]
MGAFQASGRGRSASRAAAVLQARQYARLAAGGWPRLAPQPAQCPGSAAWRPGWRDCVGAAAPLLVDGSGRAAASRVRARAVRSARWASSPRHSVWTRSAWLPADAYSPADTATQRTHARTHARSTAGRQAGQGGTGDVYAMRSRDSRFHRGRHHRQATAHRGEHDGVRSNSRTVLWPPAGTAISAAHDMGRLESGSLLREMRTILPWPRERSCTPLAGRARSMIPTLRCLEINPRHSARARNRPRRLGQHIIGEKLENNLPCSKPNRLP